MTMDQIRQWALSFNPSDSVYKNRIEGCKNVQEIEQAAFPLIKETGRLNLEKLFGESQQVG